MASKVGPEYDQLIEKRKKIVDELQFVQTNFDEGHDRYVASLSGVAYGTLVGVSLLTREPIFFNAALWIMAFKEVIFPLTDIIFLRHQGFKLAESHKQGLKFHDV